MDATTREKFDRISEFLSKRETDRQLNLQLKQDLKKSGESEHEKIEYFSKTFEEKRLDIRTNLNSSRELSKELLANHFDGVSKKILQLQKYVAASNIFLRTYDIKVYHRLLDDLTAEAKALEDELLPKKKFGFKKRKASAKNVAETDATDSPAIATLKKPQDALIKYTTAEEDFCGFRSRTDQHLTLERVSLLKKDVSLRDLENCTVLLQGSPSTLHASDLRSCVLLCGPVSTSIFAENCVDCKFVFACQQLRLHASRNVDIYLRVSSRAIMEDCQDIRFAPFDWTYEGSEGDFSEAGLDANARKDCHLFVDDFNWLSAEEKSPHWKELEESDRVTDWNAFLEQNRSSCVA